MARKEGRKTMPENSTPPDVTAPATTMDLTWQYGNIKTPYKTCEAIYVYRCCILDCPSEDKYTFNFFAGQIMPHPMTPIGWTQIDGAWICGKHQIKIETPNLEKK
jgi:hypothetical protein